MRFALGIEYEGTDFAGWQTQSVEADVLTVQDTVQTAISQIASEPIELFCSGRTDAGVHAMQQVAHFDTTAQRPDQAWVRGLNSLLPRSIAVRWVQAVDDTFHARHSSLERRYTYALVNDGVRPTRMRHQLGWVHRPLALEPMQAAAQLLLGEHDFSSFRASQCQAKHPIRTMSECAVSQQGNVFMFTVQANGFLHHMVRNMVGSLVYVGTGRWTVEHFASVFAARNRRLGAPTFSPAGLYFCGALYPEHFNIPKPRALNVLSAASE